MLPEIQPPWGLSAPTTSQTEGLDCGPSSVTSHSLQLTTKAFSFQYTWRREESPPPALVSFSGNRRQPGATGSRHQARRRQSLALLLAAPAPPPGEYRDITERSDIWPPPPGQVCKAYSHCPGQKREHKG